MARRTVGDLVVQTLVLAGVRRIYGVAGDSLNGITDSIRRRDDIHWISMRHEEVGAFAAGGWAVVGASGAGAGCAKAWCSAATSPASASTQVHCVRRNNRNIVDSSTGGFRNKEDKKTHPGGRRDWPSSYRGCKHGPNQAGRSPRFTDSSMSNRSRTALRPP